MKKTLNTSQAADILRGMRYELLDDMECVIAAADFLPDLAYASALPGNRRPMVYDTVSGAFIPVPEIP